MRRLLRLGLRHRRPRRQQRVIKRPLQVIGVIGASPHIQVRHRSERRALPLSVSILVLYLSVEVVSPKFVLMSSRVAVAEIASIPGQVVSDAKEKRIGAGIGLLRQLAGQELRREGVGASVLIAAIQVETRNSISGGDRKRV